MYASSRVARCADSSENGTEFCDSKLTTRSDEKPETVTTSTKGEVREAVDHALELMDKGEARVAEREASGKWKVHQWLKKAVLLSFRLNDMSTIAGEIGRAHV